MVFHQFFERRSTIVILSIVWGIGLAALFRPLCKGEQCIKYVAPNPKWIENKVFKVEDKCYNFKPKMRECTEDAVKAI